MAYYFSTDMQVAPDLEDGPIFSRDQFHALAPSEKPWFFSAELNELHNNMGFTGSNTTAVIIDDGCQLDHENFKDKNGKSRIISAISEVRNEGPSTGGEHGTHVAGTFAGLYTGVLPDARIVILKGLNSRGSGSSDDLTRCGYRAMELFKTGVIDTPLMVVNRSFGGGYYQPQEDQMQEEEALGFSSMSSAGNSGGSEGRPTCGHPGTTNHGCTSSAIGRNGTITDFSSRCKQVDLASPGANILSSIPGNRYGLKSGTSMSAPNGAGLIGMLQEWMLASGKPVLTTAHQLNEFFKANAIDKGKSGHDWEYGWGVLDFKTVLQMIIRGELRYV